jgi:hypothetical protein
MEPDALLARRHEVIEKRWQWPLLALPSGSLRCNNTAAIESRPAMFLVPGFFAV